MASYHGSPQPLLQKAAGLCGWHPWLTHGTLRPVQHIESGLNGWGAMEGMQRLQTWVIQALTERNGIDVRKRRAYSRVSETRKNP